MFLSFFKKIAVFWLSSALLLWLLGQWSWTGSSFCLVGLFFVLPSLALPLPVSLFCNFISAAVLGASLEEAFFIYPTLALGLTVILYRMKRRFHRDDERHLVLAAFFTNGLFLLGLFFLSALLEGGWSPNVWRSCFFYTAASQSILILCAKSFLRFQRWLIASWVKVRLSELPPIH